MRFQLAVLTIGCVSIATVKAEPVEVIPPAYVQVAERFQVPAVILYAVSLNESAVKRQQINVTEGIKKVRRPWPWTINVYGKGHRFHNKQAACTALTAYLQKTRVIDVGLAQLNIRWQPQVFSTGKRFANPCDGFDPVANLEEAAKILKKYHSSSAKGDWVVAAGQYHRPAGGKPAQRYRRGVKMELARLKRQLTKAIKQGGQNG